jgi:hypothetical protein
VIFENKPCLRLAGVSLGGHAVLAMGAMLIEHSAWKIQTTDSWGLPAAGVLLVAAVLWSATWVWRSYLLAQAEVDLGQSLLKQMVSFVLTVAMAMVSCVAVGHLMYTQLFTWYAARYEGLTTAQISRVDAKTARVSGPIGLGSAHAFEQWFMLNEGVRVVELNSSIGLAPEGINLGKLMQRHGLDAHVEHACVGACVWALVGGQRISMSDNALVACHKPYMPILGNAHNMTRADKAVMQWLKSQNFEHDSIERCLTTPQWLPHELDFLPQGGQGCIRASSC